MNSTGHRSHLSPGLDCTSFAGLLPLLGEGILDEETHDHLRQHVTTCAYCQAQVVTDQRVAGVFRRYFATPVPRLYSPEEFMQITDKEPHPLSAGQGGPSPRSPLRPHAVRPGPMRTILAVAAIAAVVVLFVFLFQGFAHPHSQSAAPTHATSTPPTAIPTHAPIQSYLVPVISPSNPQVVYRLAPTSASSTQLVFQRSPDGGASWHRFQLPAQSNGPLPSIFASPLDAQVVFVSLGGTLVNNNCVANPPLSGNSTLSSGNNVCGLQYVSQDGGAHWTQLHFSSNDILGGLSIPSNFVGTIYGSIYTLQAQGTRLYSALGPWIPSQYSSQVTFSPKIVSSDDGGLTWQIVDKGLPSDEEICDFAAAPTGSTIFALIAPTASACQAGTVPHLFLWRSDDAGAHWAQVAQLGNDVGIGMLVVSSGDGAQPIIYINTASRNCPPSGYIASSPQSGICGGAPTNLQASADGGKTWHAAPTQGYPDPKRNPGAPLGVLSDGSVLFLIQDQFYAWKLGESVWHRVGPSISGGFQYALLTSTGSGQQTLWVVTVQNTSTFTIQGYPL